MYGPFCRSYDQVILHTANAINQQLVRAAAPFRRTQVGIICGSDVGEKSLVSNTIKLLLTAD